LLICSLSVWKTRITESDPVGNFSRSERTRAIESLVHICSFLIPQAKTTELVQPNDFLLDTPGAGAQSTHALILIFFSQFFSHGY